MLINQTIEKLTSMKLYGMCEALREQSAMTDIVQLPFDERMGLLVDREETFRKDRRYKNLVRYAKIKQQASIEDIDFKTQRGLARSLVLQLGNCDWIKQHQDIIITGPTGIGKTYLACALTHRACQHGLSATFFRLPRMFSEISLARADGSYPRLMSRLSKTDVIVLDDFGVSVLNPAEARDFLEIIEDRHKTKSTIITSQLPLEKWFEAIGDSTIADSIMDRIVNNAHKIDLKGPSMRKKITKLDSKENTN